MLMSVSDLCGLYIKSIDRTVHQYFPELLSISWFTAKSFPAPHPHHSTSSPCPIHFYTLVNSLLLDFLLLRCAYANALLMVKHRVSHNVAQVLGSLEELVNRELSG